MGGLRQVLVWCTLVVALVRAQQPFQLSLIHVNDVHDKYDPISASAGACPSGGNENGICYGGIGRMKTKIMELKNTLPNPLLLNAGDTFQGTLLYTLFKWEIAVEMMNLIPFDVTALGNHEFDDGIAGVIPYMENLVSPIVAVNIDDSAEPDFKDYQSSITVDYDGTKVGVIGCISKHTSEISSSEDLVFLDEVEPVSAEAERLKAQGVDIIVLLSHSGYDVDQQLAREVPHLDVIVGAHSHTFLYTENGSPPPSNDTVQGEYPTVIAGLEGRNVLVVQAYAHSKYVGVLNLEFDDQGEVTSYTGNPQILDYTVIEDQEALEALKPYSQNASEYGNRRLGETYVVLSNGGCYDGDCNLGSFLTDGMVFEQMLKIDLEEGWTYAAIGIMNPGGIRAPIESQNITFNDLVLAQPFANTIDTIELQGSTLMKMLELAAKPSGYRSYRNFGDGRGCLQVSGIHARYNMSQPVDSRVQDVWVRCSKCRVPEYFPLDLEEWYVVAMPSFLSGGGDGYTVVPEEGRNKKVGRIDTDVFSDFITRESPIIHGVEGRIVVLE